VFFSSLARELGSRAIGIVLSGMGSDGTQGLEAISSQGGLTLAQQPDSAQFDSMPRSAIASACVDIVSLPADMPERILSVTGRQPATNLPPFESDADPAGALETVLELLQDRTRHDFAPYKSNTQLRRIARRMAVHGIDTMTAYADFLRDNPQELDLLFKEMLIGVTSFFRDPEAWQELSDDVLPTLIERHAKDAGPLRAWVIGCSTGEEAYSLAMAFTEAVESVPARAGCELQIFATDLNADAIAAARRGRFASTIARDIPAERLARFFSERPDGYLVDKRIRDMVLFAQHDVILDPPFTRLDMLSCRNLMIYFGNAL
jgi:two-component system, chemotaxis family, CheB/CheR fusion protein